MIKNVSTLTFKTSHSSHGDVFVLSREMCIKTGCCSNSPDACLHFAAGFLFCRHVSGKTGTVISVSLLQLRMKVCIISASEHLPSNLH